MSTVSVHVVGDAGVGKRRYLSSFGQNTRDRFRPYTYSILDKAVTFTFSVSSTLKELKEHKERIDVYHLLYSKRGLKTAQLWIDAIREKDPGVPIYFILTEYRFCEENMEFIHRNIEYIRSLNTDMVLCLFFENNYGLGDAMHKWVETH